jgi:hypothetical protein
MQRSINVYDSKTRCLNAAYDLIQTAVDIKSSFEGEGIALLQNPRIVVLIQRLDKATDALLATDGGL